jgi:CheY-like chemotaxis protein
LKTPSQDNPSESPPNPPPDPQAVSRQSPVAANPVPVPPQRSLQVLCIDDDEQVLESLKACLELFGHRVGAASGGRRGIEMFITATLKSEPYDVVITDLNMPDVDGYEVARQIKAESPGTPVILISGLGITLNRAAFKSAPVDAVVNKPPGMQNLNGLILQLVK